MRLCLYFSQNYLLLLNLNLLVHPSLLPVFLATFFRFQQLRLHSLQLLADQFDLLLFNLEFLCHPLYFLSFKVRRSDDTALQTVIHIFRSRHFRMFLILSHLWHLYQRLDMLAAPDFLTAQIKSTGLQNTPL